MKRFLASALSVAMVAGMATSTYAESSLGKLCWTISPSPAAAYNGATLSLQVLNYGNENFGLNGYIQLPSGTTCQGLRQVPVVGTAVVNGVTSPTQATLGFHSVGLPNAGATDVNCPGPSNWNISVNVATLGALNGGGNESLSSAPPVAGPPNFSLVLLSKCPSEG